MLLEEGVCYDQCIFLARSGSQEDQPHVQGAMAVQAQEGLEEQFHVEGQEATVRTGHGITDLFQK